ncbi:MAG: sigma-54-dependent Fis family transcriptional regulator [Tissierellia bacterium]|nr:sigma-54-dependent Fis family transcriptional regulator [Tissierellia bacterium]
MKDFKILVVDDEYEQREVFQIMLENEGYTVYTCASAEEALDDIADRNYDLVLTDLKMKNMNGLELLNEIKRIDKGIEVILVTGYGTVESAVQAMKKGAFSYFIKSHNPEALLMDIEKITRIKRLEQDNLVLRNQMRGEEFVTGSKNKAFKQILDIAYKAADSDLSILILGESGTGKEILARYIHEISPRSRGHFVAVNCHAFTEGLLESELFGHEKGAFTGAIERRIGRFEEADGGTLFLDEIGDMALSTQIKLLRAIETKSIERIGSNRSIPVDLRFISATNRDISQALEKGDFREDLYYRINAITVEIPPLRDRREDLAHLIDFFFGKIEFELKKRIVRIEDGVKEFLLSYDYPGNIRELKNIIERLVVLSEGGIIRVRDLPVDDKGPGITNALGSKMASLKDARGHFEAKYIGMVLDECDGNITRASEYLQITPRQLYNKISEYDLRQE